MVLKLLMFIHFQLLLQHCSFLYIQQESFLKLTRIGKNSQIDLIRKSKIKNLIFKLLIKINNPKFICLTNESLEYLNNNFYYNNNILIPNGIPVNNLKNINYKDEYIRILFVSRLISRKQVYKTILELIKFSSEKIKIIVCGDGPESKKIVKLQNLYPSLLITGEIKMKMEFNSLYWNQIFLFKIL